MLNKFKLYLSCGKRSTCKLGNHAEYRAVSQFRARVSSVSILLDKKTDLDIRAHSLDRYKIAKNAARNRSNLKSGQVKQTSVVKCFRATVVKCSVLIMVN